MLAFRQPASGEELREWWRRQLSRQQSTDLSVTQFCRQLPLYPLSPYRLGPAPLRPPPGLDRDSRTAREDDADRDSVDDRSDRGSPGCADLAHPRCRCLAPIGHHRPLVYVGVPRPAKSEPQFGRLARRADNESMAEASFSLSLFPPSVLRPFECPPFSSFCPLSFRRVVTARAAAQSPVFSLRPYLSSSST